jgi:hypothetical protein
VYGCGSSTSAVDCSPRNDALVCPQERDEKGLSVTIYS